MAVVVAPITRVFRYNGIKLTDPSSGKTPEEVKALYAHQYPELLNAVVEGPETKAGVSTYTFLRAVGSKGVGHLAALQAIRKGLAPSKGSPVAGASLETIQENQKCSTTVLKVVNDRTLSTPVLPPATAFSRFG